MRGNFELHVDVLQMLKLHLKLQLFAFLTFQMFNNWKLGVSLRNTNTSTAVWKGITCFITTLCLTRHVLGGDFVTRLIITEPNSAGLMQFLAALPGCPWKGGRFKPRVSAYCILIECFTFKIHIICMYYCQCDQIFFPQREKMQDFFFFRLLGQPGLQGVWGIGWLLALRQKKSGSNHEIKFPKQLLSPHPRPGGAAGRCGNPAPKCRWCRPDNLVFGELVICHHPILIRPWTSSSTCSSYKRAVLIISLHCDLFCWMRDLPCVIKTTHLFLSVVLIWKTDGQKKPNKYINDTVYTQ